MNITIQPGRLQGAVAAIPSKSQAHRLMICAAFADSDTTLVCPETTRDIEATAQCLRALGAEILRTREGYLVHPAARLPEEAVLDCGESGSTLRFLLPVVGALGVDGTFVLGGRLPQRPLSPLWEEMERMGCRLSRPGENSVRCAGKLLPGRYRISGGVSSQFISGLLFAMALMEEKSGLEITGTIESAPYIGMTRRALALFQAENGRPFRSPGNCPVEGDWSNGAFFLAANALGNPVTVSGLDADSPQGDRAVTQLLPRLLAVCPTVDARDIPDLVPILSVVAAAKNGCRFTGIHRLRLKESDRVASVIAMLKALGGSAFADGDSLTVLGGGLTGGTVDSAGDHRIAMSAAIAATVCSRAVTVLGAQTVEKSYPSFWAEYRRLGGKYEQQLW